MHACNCNRASSEDFRLERVGIMYASAYGGQHDGTHMRGHAAEHVAVDKLFEPRTNASSTPRQVTSGLHCAHPFVRRTMRIGSTTGKVAVHV